MQSGKKQKLTVLHIMRRPYPGAFSIETLYENIRKAIPGDFCIRVFEARYYSLGILRRILNALSVIRLKADVYHITGDVHYMAYFLPVRKTIITIHDCDILDRSEGLKKWIIWFFWYWLPEKRCSGIIAVSFSTKNKLLQYLNCKPEKIRVIYNQISENYRPYPKQFNLNRPRLLQVGTKQNKNIIRLAEALEGLRSELVIIGRLDRLQQDALIKHNIDYHNKFEISDTEIIEEYKHCDVVVFVSIYEGFGLPILEANAIGRPVVTSNVHSMPEVAGDAACFVNPFDVISIREGINRVLDSPDYRKDLIERGFQNVKRFSSNAISGQYANYYRHVYEMSVS